MPALFSVMQTFLWIYFFLEACILFNYFTSNSSLRRSIHELPRKEPFLLISLKMYFVLKKTLPSIANRSAEHLAKLQFQIDVFFGGGYQCVPYIT